MVFSGYHSEIPEGSIRETEGKEVLSRQEKDGFEAQLYADFGFDPEAMRKTFAENYYQELMEKRDAEFKEEYDRYTNPDLYTSGGLFSHMKEGPNCVAFAFRWLKNPVTGRKFLMRPEPGEIARGHADGSCIDSIKYGTTEYAKAYLEGEICKDLECVGMEMQEVDSQDYKLKDGEWMIAMVSAKDIGGFPDYHFYRKGEHGTWYHKPGVTPPTRLDASGKEILDPKSCDRGPYETFHGYYVVRPIAQRA